MTGIVSRSATQVEPTDSRGRSRRLGDRIVRRGVVTKRIRHDMSWAHVSLELAVLIAVTYPLVPSRCLAQMPQAGDPIIAWANWINQQTPQAVPQQTITLGTLHVSASSPSKMLWQPSVPSYFCSPGGGGVVSLNPPVCLSLNSYDMQYQIVIARPANYDMQVVFLGPQASGGTEKITGTIQDSSSSTTHVPVHPGIAPLGGRSITRPNSNVPSASGAGSNIGTSTTSIATISFHPHVLGTQYIQFFHAGSLMNCDFGGQSLPCSFSIKAALQPQLGAFVVPYLPVTVIYQPQGCGQCPSGTCGSSADYVVGSTWGTTLSWDYSSSSGSVNSQSSSDLTDNASAFLSALSMIPGPNSAALSTASSVLGAVKSIWNTEQITTSQSGQGTTQTKGWSVTFKHDFETDVCRNEDLFVFLQNVLFVYTVVPRDPVSGNASPYGVPTVALIAIHYDEPIVAYWTSEVQTKLPPPVAQQFLALDLQLNPGQLKLAMLSAQPPMGQACQQSSKPQTGGPNATAGQPMNMSLRGRLSYVSCEACPTSYYDGISEAETNFAQTATYQTQTTTATTNVTGFLASLLGKAGETIQTVTYTSNRANWQQVETESGLKLQCPEYAPAEALNMNVFFDTMLGSLIAVPAGIKQPTPGAAAANPEGVQGTVHDTQGRPVANQPVVLNIAGHRFGARSDSNGNFAFRSRVPILPTGSGSLIVGNERFPVTYNRTLTTLNLNLSGSVTASATRATTAANAATTGSAPAARNASSGIAPSPPSVAPLSAVTAIDAGTGIVTAKVSATGQTFQFKLSNRALTSQMRVGEGVYANFTNRQVSLDGRSVAGTITAIAPAIGSGPRQP